MRSGPSGVVFGLVAVLALGAGVSGAPDADPWAIVKPLEGIWEGTGEGFGRQSTVTHTWEFIFEGTFLRLTTESRDSGGGVHRDVGYLSRDTDNGTFVFRQFNSEGFVNTYEVLASPDGSRMNFAHRECESAGGMKARMLLAMFGKDKYEMTLELASGSMEFSPCQRMTMRRKTDG